MVPDDPHSPAFTPGSVSVLDSDWPSRATGVSDFDARSWDRMGAVSSNSVRLWPFRSS